MAEPQFVHNPDENRYEIIADGDVIGFSAYRDSGEVRDVLHTEVDAAWAGQGLATRLLEFALDDIRASGKVLVATCPLLRGYLRKHPEQRDLLAPR